MKFESNPVKVMLALSFTESKNAVRAVEFLKANGIVHFECYGPFGTEEIFDAIGPVKSRLPLAALVGGIIGALSGYFLQWWTAVRQYPLNVGGRPLHSWPAFIPITFEMTILCATLAIIGTFFYSAGYPCLYHKAFDIPDFERASDDTFFVCVTEPEQKIRELRDSKNFANLNAERISYVTQ